MSSYKTAFHAKAAAELQGIPERACVALYGALVEISLAPWAATTPDKAIEDESFRFALFDDGDGVVHLRINDQARTVTVHGITWIG